MKKTLVAMAVLAVAGAASAQVTLSGKLAFGYAKAIGADAGMQVTDGDLRATAVEDLGNGLKATVAAEMTNRGRQSAIAGRDATMKLEGSFGTVVVGNIEAGNGIVGRGFAGAPVSLASGYDNGTLLDGAANADYFAYSTPSMSGVVVSVKYLDSVGSAVGSSGGDGGSTAAVFGVDYAAGPLSAGIDTTSFSTAGSSSRLRASASYDLGMAVLGVGYSKTGSAATQTAMGVKVPMGAVTLGAIYAQRSSTVKGFGLGMDYALSKTTAVNVSYGDVTTLADGTQYRIRLLKSF